MKALSDIKALQVTVECIPCQRRGVYAFAGLVARFGSTAPLATVLSTLTANCRFRSASAPQENGGCVAQMLWPKPAPSLQGPPTPIQHGLRVEVWTPNDAVEWHLATVWSYDLGRAALDAAALLYPDREVTLRHDCRVIAKRKRPT